MKIVKKRKAYLALKDVNFLPDDGDGIKVSVAGVRLL